MTTSSVISSTATEPRPAPPAPVRVAESRRGRLGGLEWQYRPGCETLLNRCGVDIWAHPARQGWRLVKANARREVWRAEIEGAAYYLKYYFGGRWRDLLTRLTGRSACGAEYQGGLFALRAGLPAVRPVACTLGLRREGRPCGLLITESAEPAQPLHEFWRQVQTDPDARRRRSDVASLADLLAQMIARSHQAGFEHLDMHVANILVQPVGPRVYRALFVDLHSARRGVPIRAAAVVRNLAQLNQWFRKHSTTADRLRFLRAYLRWRDEYEHQFEHGRALELTFGELVRALDVAARRHAERLGAQRDHRVFRSGRYFTRLKLPGGWTGVAMLCCKQPSAESHASGLVFERDWWQKQLGDPRRWFDARAGGTTCKDSHSATVRRAALPHPSGDIQVILKRPRARNWRRRVALALPPSRSARGWETGHALLHRDVATARPLALLERRAGPLVLDSVLVTEALPGTVDLETFLRSRSAATVRTPRREWFRVKRDLTLRLVALLRRLQERGFDHRDCKAGNILVLAEPAQKLLWIDMDGLRNAGPLTEAERLKPLVRLHVSLLEAPGLTRTDRARFLRAYCARFGAPRDAWRRVWPELTRAAEAKQRALAARRAWKVKHYGRV